MRQGFWNGALPPIGYRIIAGEQRGTKTKKTLEIDPMHADTVRLVFRLALFGADGSGAMGLKSICKYLNEHHIWTRDSGKWGIGSLHQILTRETYVGRSYFNTRDHKTKTLKDRSEWAEMAVPPIIPDEEFDALSGRRAIVAPQQRSASPSHE